MIDALRDRLYRVIATPRGGPLRIPKDLARRMNTMLGSPLCTREEIDKRRAARARLDELRTKRSPAKTGARAAAPVAAPVMVYFEKDRNARELGRIRETLDARAIAYTLLDVAGDETTLAFVMREAKCEEDDLPIVFVAGRAIGTFRDVVEADVCGALAAAVSGTATPS